METIRALSEEIGPRLACSQAEARAAQWCAAGLGESGYDAAIEEFPSRTNYALWYVGYLSLSLVGALLVVPLPPLGLVMGAAGLLLYARDSDGRPLIRPSGGISRNVVARPRGGGSPDVVVMAHLDSARSSPSFHPKLVGNFHASTVALNLSLIVVPVLAGAAWIAEASGDLPITLWIPAGLLAAYLAFAIGLLSYGHFRMPAVPGANDNASGVAVLMRLARMEWGDGVWFVVTGSEEVGSVGVQAFLAKHDMDVGGSRFLNIDNVGAGRLLALSGEGVLRRHHPDPFMLDVAVEAGVDEEPFKGLPTDATALLARRIKALTLLAVNEQGVPPNWHWPTDTLANTDPTALDRATDAATSIVAAVRSRETIR
jgi:hypothetical protein